MFKFVKVETALIVLLSLVLIVVATMYAHQVQTLAHDEGMLKFQQQVITGQSDRIKILGDQLTSTRLEATRYLTTLMDLRDQQRLDSFKPFAREVRGDNLAPPLPRYPGVTGLDSATMKKLHRPAGTLATDSVISALTGGVHIGRRMPPTGPAPK